MNWLGIQGLLTVLLGIGCTAAPATTSAPAPPKAEEARSQNQVLRVARTGLPAAITPEVTNVNNDVFNTIFDGLTSFGDNYTIKPAVAEKWEYTGGTWRFTIRQDLVFSNGDKLTADDVVYSANLIAEKNLPPKTFLPSLTGARKIDERTVEIQTKQPDVMLVNGAPWIYILPQKHHQQVGTSEFGLKPVGTGPYQVESYKANQELVVTRRTAPHPYRKPIPTEIRFLVIPDLSQQVVGLRTGDLDISVGGVFNNSQVDTLKSAGIQIEKKLASNSALLFSQPEAEARATPLRDKRVRQALNYAVNKAAIADGLYGGLAKPAGQFGSPGSLFWDDAVQAIPFDPAKAKQLLAEAGYPNGFTLPVGLGFSSALHTADIAASIQSDLRGVGVEAPVTNNQLTVYSDKMYARSGNQKEDLFLTSLGDPSGSFAAYRGFYDCAKQGFEVWWCTPEFNRLYDQAVQEADATKRAALMRDSNRAIRDDVPAVWLVVREATNALTSKIKGFEWLNSLQFNFDSVYRVD